MSEFVTLNHYPGFVYDGMIRCYGDGDYLKPFKITLNIDSIMSIDDKPHTLIVYMKYEDKGTSAYTHMVDVHLLTTNANASCGLNSVDFKSYYITKESYSKLMKVLDPFQCA